MDRISINRSYDRAHDQARQGNIPTLFESRFTGATIWEKWVVQSRSDEPRGYTVTLAHTQRGIETTCDCPAAYAGRCCWHRGAARLAHLDAIPSHREVGITRYRAKPNTTLATISISAAALSGKRG